MLIAALGSPMWFYFIDAWEQAEILLQETIFQKDKKQETFNYDAIQQQTD